MEQLKSRIEAVLFITARVVQIEEIAEILNTNIRSVDNAIQRIRKKFKKLYKAS